MLKDAAIRRLKPRATPFKVTDRDGLYLLVQPTGAKWWRFDYRFAGRRKTISVGVYPETTLSRARTTLARLREQLAASQDPSVLRRTETRRREFEARNSFAIVAREWLEKQRAKLAPATVDKITWIFEGYLFPAIGTRPIGDIEPPDLLDALRRIEGRGKLETAHRAKQISGQVFRYAIASHRARRDPSADLQGALAPVVVKHHASITDPHAIGALLRAIEGFSGSFPVWQALRLAPLVFVRPGELRKAEWAEIDLEAGLWRIPAARMKTRQPHLVPLARQAVEILRELRPLTGRGGFVFPSIRSNARPMSDNTLNAALRRLGYGHQEMTSHGFRSMASTRLNEMGWNGDIIERQLAHAEKDRVRAAYNYAQYLDERRRMMQTWADHLDGLRAQAPAALSPDLVNFSRQTLNRPAL